jgi:hypothetical protein
MENKIENMRYWVEPAHPMVIKLFDDLVIIYRFVKDTYQKDVDAAFDRASKQIGFVVTTTVPVMLEVGEGGAVKSLSMGSECLKGTALEKELLMVFDSKILGGHKINVSPGVYNMALFWYDALKLKLKMDWMEPAHPVYRLQSELMGLSRSPQSARALDVIAQPQPWLEPAHHPGCRPWLEPAHTPWLEPAHHGPWCRPWLEPAHPHTPWLEPAHQGPWCRPWMEPAHPVFEKASVPQKGRDARMFEHQEPAHYLDRVNQIILEKSILVSAIDEVYPELKLGERLNEAQYAMSPTLPLPPPRAVWPGVREPAHMMPHWARDPTPEPWRQLMTEIAQLLARYEPEPSPWKYHFLSEIASILARYSYAMLNPQPLPPRMAAWPGVREPAHMMAPQWASGPTPDPWGQMNFPGVREPAHQMAGMQPEMSQQMLSEMAALMRRYGFQI